MERASRGASMPSPALKILDPQTVRFLRSVFSTGRERRFL
jgi:hypothetical protein